MSNERPNVNPAPALAGAPSGEWYRPSYGIDFKFTHVRSGLPVCLPHETILVRLVGEHPECAIPSLHLVASEIAEHSGLGLVVGDPERGDGRELVTDFAVRGEIRVMHREFDQAGIPPTLANISAAVLGLGGAVMSGDDSAYIAGYAVLDPQRIGHDFDRYLSVLRHELGHAMGLSHASRASTLMYVQATTPEWQAGDIAGLRLLGRQEVPSGYAPTRSPNRPSATCGAPH